MPFNVIGGSDLSIHEVDEAAQIIAEAASPDANIIFGATIDESATDQIKITVIATGFDVEAAKALEKLKIQRSTSPLDSARDGRAGPKAKESPKEERENEGGSSEDWKDKFDVEDKYDIPTFLRKR